MSLPFIYYQVTRGTCFGLDAFIFSMACNGIFLYLFIRFRATAYPDKRADKQPGGGIPSSAAAAPLTKTKSL
jgi:hypothetical protein